MTLAKASQTALMVAAYRARACARGSELCKDSWAEPLAGAVGFALARAFDERFAPMELWVEVRTAYLDNQVHFWTAPPHGLGQVVLLGAGLDTRAGRLADCAARFFEVDHPLTQAYKRHRLSELLDYPDNAATFVPCDFAHDDFVTQLVAGGFDPTAPALVLWEGVTPYLPEATIRATLRRFASGLARGSVLLFDHLAKPRATEESGSHAFVEALGEQVLWGTNDPLPMLFEEGFGHVRSVSFDEACLTLTGTYERERQFRFQHLVLARTGHYPDGLAHP